MFLEALVAPALIYLILADFFIQWLATGWNPYITAAPVVITAGVFRWWHVSRERQLEPLLACEPRPMREVTADEFGVSGAATAKGRALASQRKKIEALLPTRRLVLLVGPHFSGRSRLAHQALDTKRYRRHRLLRPGLQPAGSDPPLSKLLTSGVLTVRGRYVLWLDDLAHLMQNGFDPRSVERWLIAGGGRVAIARITPVELARLKEADITAAVSLRRAIEVKITPPRGWKPSVEAAERYSRLQRDYPEQATAVRIVASLELLGIPSRELTRINQLLERLGVPELSEQRAIQLTRAPFDLLKRGVNGNLAVHSALLEIIDESLPDDLDHGLLTVLLSELSTTGLLAASLALAVRDKPDEADELWKRANVIAPSNKRSAVDTVALRIAEFREGSSEVKLAATGGWDTKEPIGWHEEKALKERFERVQRAADRAGDKLSGPFDLSLPEESEGFASRMFRLTLQRAAVRVTSLALLDGLSVAAAALVALVVRGLINGHGVQFEADSLVNLAALAVPIEITIAVTLGLYTPHRPRAQIGQILIAVALVSATVAGPYFARGEAATALAAAFTMFATAFFVDTLLRWVYEQAAGAWIVKKGLHTRVLVMGDTRDATGCAMNVSESRRPSRAIAYVAKTKRAGDPYCVGSYAELGKWLINLHIDEVVIADTKLKLAEKADFAEQIQRLGLEARFVASDEEIMLGAVGRTDDHDLVHIPSAPMTPEALELKRLVDVTAVTISMPAWAAILLAYAVYSKLNWPGQKVIVETHRIGLGDVAFRMLRLRTRLRLPDGSHGGEPASRIEEIFERYGLDEFPQLINVLRGEMSMVGPRPLAAEDVRNLKGPTKRLLATRPGMTGRWQLDWGQAANDYELRALDAEYLRRWRLTHDIELIVRTPLVVAHRRRYVGDNAIRRRLRNAQLKA